MRSRKVLVTGASGFIGRHLVKNLQETETYDVTMWTRQIGDLRDADIVKSALSQERPDIIFHLAAQMPGVVTQSWSAIASEQAMLANLAYSMPAHARLVYTGSVAEYGKSGTLREIEQCSPDSGYGCAKFSGTTLAITLRSMLGIDVRVARLFGVYGPGEDSSRLLPSLVGNLNAGRDAPLSDGQQVRDFVHVDDVCAALIGLSEASVNPEPDIVNIGTGVGIRVRDVCEIVATILNADPRLLKFGAVPRKVTDQDHLVADTQKLRSLLTVPPQRWLHSSSAADIISSFLSHQTVNSVTKIH